MPQMAPINWLILYLIFSLSLILFCMMNYYMITPNTKKFLPMNKLTKSMNWKW
nr:ATP synthase F0 subunit 8 [Claraeola sicilis]